MIITDDCVLKCITRLLRLPCFRLQNQIMVGSLRSEFGPVYGSKVIGSSHMLGSKNVSTNNP